MPPPEDLYPPVTQTSSWTTLAVVLLVAAVVWWVVLWWRTRRPPAPAAEAMLTGTALAACRVEYVAEIDAVARDHDAGRCSSREVFQRLSPLVRRYVFDVSGVPVHTMTLATLRRRQQGELAETVARWYPSEFSAFVDADVPTGLDHARHFVQRWPVERTPAGTSP